MSTQPLLTRTANPGSGNTWAALSESGGFNASSTQGPQPWSVDGVFRNLRVTLDTAPGSGNSRTFAVEINGVLSGVTVTISDLATSATDTTHSIAVSAGNKIALKHAISGTPTTPTDVQVSIDFDSTNAGESGYGSRIAAGITDGTTRYFPLFNPAVVGTVLTEAQATEPVPCAGALTRLDLMIDASTLAGGSSYVARIKKNGVLQDGTGGTVDTTCTLTGAGPANSTFDLPLVAGDTVCLEVIDTAAVRVFGYACRFAATTPGESIFAGGSVNQPDNSATEFLLPVNSDQFPWQSIEGTNSSVMLAGVTPFTLSNFYILSTTAPGSGKGYTFTFRQNASDPVGGLAVTVNDLEVSEADLSGLVAVSAGDALSMRSVPSGTPALASVRWSLALSTEAVVDAGPDQEIELPPGTTTLAGSSKGFSSTPTYAWTVISAPPAGTVTFDDDTDPTTGVSFSHHGEYVLRLTGTEGSDSAFDDVTITVEPPSGTGATYAINDVPLERIIENPGRRGVRISLSLGSLWICDLETYDNDSTSGAYRPDLRDLLTVDYEGQRIFRGHVITRRDRPRARTNKGNRMGVRAKANLLTSERIEVHGVEIAAGETLKSAVTTLLNHGDPSLADHGIALDPDMADGPTLEAITFDGVTMQSAFNRLMERSGDIIRITPEDVLEAFAPGDKVADFSLRDDNTNARGAVTWEETARRFVNRVHLKYGTGLTTKTETFTADGTTRQFPFHYTPAGTPQPAGTHPAIYVDGVYNHVEQHVEGEEPLFEWAFDYDLGDHGTLIQRAEAPTGTFYDPEANGIVITTTPFAVQFPLTVTVEDAASILADGLWERTFAAPDIFDEDEATEYAEGLLRAATAPKIITVRTREFPMPLPGDVINLSFPDRLLPDDDYLIIRVDAEDYVDKKFEFTLTCVEGTEVQRSWTDTLKSLIGAS